MDYRSVHRVKTEADRERLMLQGEERMGSRCFCGELSPHYSTYCKSHAFRNKRWGHPEVRLLINTRVLRDNTKLLGREVMEFIAPDATLEDPCWDRIAGRIEAISKDPAFRFDIPTLVRRQSSWRQPFIAAGLIGMHSRDLTRRFNYTPEENARGFLESHLGMAARFLHASSVGDGPLLTARQIVFGLNKNAGRAIICGVRTKTKDPHDPEKVWKYRVRPGVITAVGRIMSELISREFGTRYWKLVSDAVAMMPHRVGRDLPFLLDNQDINRTTTKQRKIQ